MMASVLHEIFIKLEGERGSIYCAKTNSSHECSKDTGKELLAILKQQNEISSHLFADTSSLPKKEIQCFDGSDITDFDQFWILLE